MGALLVLTDIIEKLILLALFGLSIYSIALIFEKRKLFKSEESFAFDDLLQKMKTQSFGSAETQWPQQTWIKKLYDLFQHQNLPAALDREFLSLQKQERQRLEKGLTWLATLGSNAPFLGLLGTVFGIIRAFAFLGSQSGSGAVMSGVSQALYATAMGLVVALPAVVAYNHFNQRLKSLSQKMESLKERRAAILISQGD